MKDQLFILVFILTLLLLLTIVFNTKFRNSSEKVLLIIGPVFLLIIVIGIIRNLAIKETSRGDSLYPIIDCNSFPDESKRSICEKIRNLKHEDAKLEAKNDQIIAAIKNYETKNKTYEEEIARVRRSHKIRKADLNRALVNPRISNNLLRIQENIGFINALIALAAEITAAREDVIYSIRTYSDKLVLLQVADSIQLNTILYDLYKVQNDLSDIQNKDINIIKPLNKPKIEEIWKQL